MLYRVYKTKPTCLWRTWRLRSTKRPLKKPLASSAPSPAVTSVLPKKGWLNRSCPPNLVLWTSRGKKMLEKCCSTPKKPQKSRVYFKTKRCILIIIYWRVKALIITICERIRWCPWFPNLEWWTPCKCKICAPCLRCSKAPWIFRIWVWWTPCKCPWWTRCLSRWTLLEIKGAISRWWRPSIRDRNPTSRRFSNLC